MPGRTEWNGHVPCTLTAAGETIVKSHFPLDGSGDLKPIKKFTDRKTAASRIWKGIQVLGEEVLRTSIRDAEGGPSGAPVWVPSVRLWKAKGSKAARAAADAPTPTPDASTPRVPREFSKKAIVREMLVRTGGATLQEIVDATGWQKHTVRGFISTLPKEDRDRDHQHPARVGQVRTAGCAQNLPE